MNIFLELDIKKPKGGFWFFDGRFLFLRAAGVEDSTQSDKFLDIAGNILYNEGEKSDGGKVQFDHSKKKGMGKMNCKKCGRELP